MSLNKKCMPFEVLAEKISKTLFQIKIAFDCHNLRGYFVDDRQNV